VEPSRSRLPGRAGSPLLSTEPSRLRVRVRSSPHAQDTPSARDEPTAADAPPERDAASNTIPLPRAALLAAALVLAATSRGDVTVLALLLAFGAATRASGLASATALFGALVRWGSPSLGAIAGAQAVLGPAGWTGSALAIGSAWLAAGALVLAAVPIERTRAWVVAASTAPFGIAAADLVVGPAPGGALALRVLGSAVAVAITTAVARRRALPRTAVVLGVLSLLCAGLAR
jgi:hypothetical protein